MEDKTAKELVKQLTRIADALEKANNLEAVREKRKIKLEKLEEKKLKEDLREKINIDPAKVIKEGPEFRREG